MHDIKVTVLATFKGAGQRHPAHAHRGMATATPNSRTLAHPKLRLSPLHSSLLNQPRLHLLAGEAWEEAASHQRNREKETGSDREKGCRDSTQEVASQGRANPRETRQPHSEDRGSSPTSPVRDSELLCWPGLVVGATDKSCVTQDCDAQHRGDARCSGLRCQPPLSQRCCCYSTPVTRSSAEGLCAMEGEPCVTFALYVLKQPSWSPHHPETKSSKSVQPEFTELLPQKVTGPLLGTPANEASKTPPRRPEDMRRQAGAQISPSPLQ